MSRTTIADVAGAVSRMREFTPDSHMMIVAAPDALDELWRDLGWDRPRPTFDATCGMTLLGMQVMERADMPPRVMYVVDKRYAPEMIQ